jgi:MYXO-CTERM domain-containing protein
MRRRTLFTVLVASAVTITVPLTAQADALFTIGPDADFSPRVLNQLPKAAPVSASPLASLGDGSIGFNGGLAYDTSNAMLYAIGNDSQGGSALYSFTTSGGSLTSIAALGSGFNGGLAYDSADGNFYAIANDNSAASRLYRVTPAGVATPLSTGPIGSGFYGGLSYDSSDGNLYAIAGDASGTTRTLAKIDIPSVSAMPLFGLGDGSLGFNGGLAYDNAANLFYVIGNDFGGNSTLFSFTLGGTGTDLTPIGASFGQGFLNVGLALAPAVTTPTVDEPPTLALVALIALLGLAGRRSNRRRATDPGSSSVRPSA